VAPYRVRKAREGTCRELFDERRAARSLVVLYDLPLLAVPATRLLLLELIRVAT
jgi:hypothetical protein